MIGKLQNWRGEGHGKKDWRHSGVGGLVSLEDLAKKPKSSPAKAGKKKVPFLSLGRQSVTLKSLQAQEEAGVHDNEPVASDLSLFSNIPASAGLNASFPRSPTSSSRPASPARPKTADPERASFARRRSKTLPTDAPQLSLDFTDKPLPLAVEFDGPRKRSVSTNHSSKSGTQDHAGEGSSISRPRTSQSMESRSSLQGSRQRSNSNSKGSKPTYSLTPAISPTTSRRPSLSGADIQNIAQVALSKSPSNASHTSNRPRSNSKSSLHVQPPERPAPVPSPARSVLDEVEGTLSATIRELQDLQGDWEHPSGFRPMRTSSLMYKMPSAPEVPRSAPPIQEEFPVRSNSHDATTARRAREDSQPPSPAPSIPSTPRSASLPKEAPSLGRMQSIQIAYEKSKATAHKLGVENDTLKQQMRFMRERFAEMGDLKAEKETLEVALEESRSNIEASVVQLQAVKANEQAITNNLTNVTRRLEEANVQKVDVLEQNSELQDEISNLKREMASMWKVMEELRERPKTDEVEELRTKLAKAEEENKILAEQAKAAEGRADLPAVVADLSFKLDDAKRSVSEKDKYIDELETQTGNLSTEMDQLREERAKMSEENTTLRAQATSQKSSSKRASLLHKQLEELEKARVAAQAESDKHLQLLKEQLRRTANETNKREHPASNLLEKRLNIEEAVAEVRLKFERRLAREKGEDADEDEEDEEEKDPEVRIEELEREVEYHVKDIVLYKLDVKGYRKDLKRAKEKIATLTEAAAAATAAAEEAAEAARKASVSAMHKANRPSLSSHSSVASVPQLSPSAPRDGGAASDNESLGPATPSLAAQLQVQVPVRHIVSAWSPGASPRTTPLSESKAMVSA